MTQKQIPNPAPFLYPGYFRFFQEIANMLYITFVADHPLVEIKGPANGFVTSMVPCISGDTMAEKELRTLTVDVTIGAIGNFYQNDDGLGFSARFQQQIVHIYIPWVAMISIFDPRSNPRSGFGLPYREPDAATTEKPADTPTDPAPSEPAGGHLKRVK